MEINFVRGKYGNVFFNEDELSSFIDCQALADYYNHLTIAKRDKKRELKEAIHWSLALIMFVFVTLCMFIGVNQ